MARFFFLRLQTLSTTIGVVKACGRMVNQPSKIHSLDLNPLDSLEAPNQQCSKSKPTWFHQIWIYYSLWIPKVPEQRSHPRSGLWAQQASGWSAAWVESPDFKICEVLAKSSGEDLGFWLEGSFQKISKSFQALTKSFTRKILPLNSKLSACHVALGYFYL